MKTLRLLTTALFALTLIFTSCERDDDLTPNDGQMDMTGDDGGNDNDDDSVGNLDQFFGAQISRDFLGQVVDENGNGIAGALVKTGGTMVSTDNNGVFFMENATVNEGFGYLRVTANGYVTSGRALLPTSGTNKVEIMLLSADVTATVNSGVAETVSLPNGTQVNLSGDYIDENGNPYSGTVDVILDYLDPASQDIDTVMPGMLYAEDASGDERYLETFGMISVELRDNSGNELNIDPNSPAELRFPLDPALQGVAPATIPLWSFDDVLGYWIEDGEATLQGNEYVGEVSHFSFWNCDAPFPVEDFCTTLLDPSGNPLTNTLVTISSPNTPFPRHGVTNQNGEVCGKVPSGIAMVLTVEDFCGNAVYSNTIGPFTATTNYGPITITPGGGTTSQQVTGQFNNCSGNPVTNGYVVVDYAGSQFIDYVSSGSYSVNLISCAPNNNFTLEAIDIANQETSGQIAYTFTPPVTSLGTITSCNAVAEYIEWTIDGTAYFETSPINNDTNLGGGFTVYANASSNFFYMSSSDTTLGTYTWGNGIQAPPGSMEMEMYEVLSSQNVDYNQPINITFQLNAYGPVGGYIDLTFGGTFTDNAGAIIPINGSMHVIRDN